MKKILLIFTIIFLVSITIFFISAAVEPGLNEKTYFSIWPSRFNNIKEEKLIEIDNGYTDIDIDISSSKTTIKQSTDNITRVTYKRNGTPYRLEASVKDDTLVVKEKGSGFVFMTWFNDNSEVIIEIPKGDYGEIGIDISSGSVTASDLSINAESLELEVSSGKINISGIAFEEYSIECASGKVDLHNASGRGDVEVASGKVTVRYDEWNGSLEASVTSGKAEFKLPKDSGIKLRSSIASGKIEYDIDGDEGKIANGGFGGGSLDIGGDNSHDVDVKVASGKVVFGSR